LVELLKLDPRQLLIGREQSVVGKSNLRRLVYDTIQSCVAHVGCNLSRAPLSLLRHVPGLDFDLAQKLLARQDERPFTSREDLRTEGLLDGVQWTNAVAFLRIEGSSEPLDRTSLHPEQYPLARAVIEKSGGTIIDALGRRDAAKGLRRADLDVDEPTWRD